MKALSKAKNFSVISGSLGFSYKGQFDIGFIYGRSNIENSIWGTESTAESFAPNIAIYLATPNKGDAFTVALSFAYELIEYSDDYLPPAQQEISGDVFSMGLMSIGHHKFKSGLDAYPFIGLSYFVGKVKFYYDDNFSSSEKSEGILVNVGLSLSNNSIADGSLILTPQLAITKQTTTMSLNLSYLIKFN